VNELHRRASDRVQRGRRKSRLNIGTDSAAISQPVPRNKKENTMLKTFSVALIATALIAGPAFAQASGANGAAPAPAAAATQSQAAPTVGSAAATTPAKTTTTVTATAKHVKKHVARAKSGTKAGSMHQARHVKSTKTHQAGVIGVAKRS
jgi:hypothetical protein